MIQSSVFAVKSTTFANRDIAFAKYRWRDSKILEPILVFMFGELQLSLQPHNVTIHDF